MSGDAQTESPYRSVEGLRVTRSGPALELEIDRPAKRNALTDPIVQAMIGALAAAGPDESVRVVVLRGAGEHFCAGFDIVGRNADDVRPRVGSIQRRLPTEAHRLIELLLTTQTPVVCAVRGWAAGIGLHLVLASDFAVVDDAARLWEPYAQRGFTPDTGGTWLLPRRIGEARAREMLVLGQAVSGSDAAAMGMVHRAVAADTLDAEVQGLVDRLAQAPTVTIGLTKWLLHAGASAPLAEQLQNEAMAMELSSRSEDFREGLTAFVERRPPRFSGR
ncbi:MAG TPA: enoyl-CoA hydratase-related protein [Acidimicrobiales bacterium]|jgi:2-(1,2-epoxy-1,2-dihydrophenyl)acetyl-CoA isomerase|nr:enoyl-CoA hydratase-related protein [Acidimicrobiales bacterium]